MGLAALPAAQKVLWEKESGKSFPYIEFQEKRKENLKPTHPQPPVTDGFNFVLEIRAGTRLTVRVVDGMAEN